MQAEVSVELGAQDDCLEIPWSSPEGEVRYYDLRRRPELLLHVAEAHNNRELGEFLASINSSHSILETAKCDTWLSDQMTEEESIYGAAWKFGSYVDLIFNETGPRMSLERHQELAASTSRLLRRVPEIPAAAELVVRRCYYHDPKTPDPEASETGFCVTFYLYGYGDEEAEARQRWAIALKVVENALLQLSAAQRRATTAG
jgi:hypothetical protein